MKRLLTRAGRTEAARHQLRDGLTSLASRSLLVDRVRQAVAAQARRGGPVAVLFIDIEDFRAFTDARGPTVADQLLISVADRLEQRLRATDTLARTAGDEFGLLFEGLADVDGALDAAQRVVDAMAEPFAVPGELISVSAKVGLSVGEADVSADDLLRNAGLALEEAHATSGPRFVVHEADRYADALEHLAVKSELAGALSRQELSVRYQPIMSLTTGSVVAVEALVRWQRPDGSMCRPDVFIPIAERTHLVADIDRFVLREACREAAKWKAGLGEGAPEVAVNLSASSLQSPELVGFVEETLGDTGLAPGSLTLEVTEQALISEGELAARNLTRLKRRGASVALDDFGTGHSSLSHLGTFPVDQLKIDRSFVDHIEVDRGDRVARAILTLADALGLQAVAEGVERQEQRDALTALGCTLAQGFLFARPLEAGELSHLLGIGEAPDDRRSRLIAVTRS